MSAKRKRRGTWLDQPRAIGGRNLWYGLDLEPIGTAEADELLGSYLKRLVARTDLGDWAVSTVFLVLDHGWARDSPPVLWETAVFKPDGEIADMRRYASREAASKGHDEITAELRAYLGWAEP